MLTTAILKKKKKRTDTVIPVEDKGHSNCNIVLVIYQNILKASIVFFTKKLTTKQTSYIFSVGSICDRN